MKKRVFLIVLDSFGVGEMPDAHRFGDQGSNTLNSIRNLPEFDCPNLVKLGLLNIDGVGGGIDKPMAHYGKCMESSNGKDTTVGHWEIAGLVSDKDLPTFPNGFPKEIIDAFEKATGRKTLCNKPYSGTEVIKDYGAEHIKKGDLIVYTSADSVFQIAAHESVVSLSELYDCCVKARKILDKFGVGRVIARPFSGEYPFVRTASRRDYSIEPHGTTMLDILKENGKDVIAVGKISDIFAGRGITQSYHTKSNVDGMRKTDEIAGQDFDGLCFVNLVEFDSNFGHRNNTVGYAKAMSEFDRWLGGFLDKLSDKDLLIITADHGCDPSTPSTDHSREYTPLLVVGSKAKGKNLGIRESFADISATILDYHNVDKKQTQGNSFLGEIKE